MAIPTQAWSIAAIGIFTAVAGCASGEADQPKSAAVAGTLETGETAQEPTQRWTPFDDAQAGLHIDMPCANPASSVKSGVVGPMQVKTREVTCIVGSSRYTLEYWVTMTMDFVAERDKSKVTAALEGWTAGWIGVLEREGYTISGKGVFDFAPGWVAGEIRGTRGRDIRADRHYTLLPRYIVTRTSGPAADGPEHDRFNRSMKIGQLGARVGDPQVVGMAERPIDLGGVKFAVTLPCPPIFGPDQTEMTPDGELKMRNFECRDPAANRGFRGTVGRLSRAATGSAQARRPKNMQVTADIARETCAVLRAQSPKMLSLIHI